MGNARRLSDIPAISTGTSSFLRAICCALHMAPINTVYGAVCTITNGRLRR